VFHATSPGKFDINPNVKMNKSSPLFLVSDKEMSKGIDWVIMTPQEIITLTGRACTGVSILNRQHDQQETKVEFS
jgi:hypothetical protein